jgi:hypothetical protein
LFDADSWRAGLVSGALNSLNNTATEPFTPSGPFRAEVSWRAGDIAAQNLARRWGFDHEGARIFMEAADIHELYRNLIRLCYLTPLTVKILPFGLFLYNLTGRLGLKWVRWRQRPVVKRYKLAGEKESSG